MMAWTFPTGSETVTDGSVSEVQLQYSLDFTRVPTQDHSMLYIYLIFKLLDMSKSGCIHFKP